MKAVVFHEFGGSDVLRVEELPDPVPGPGEVLLGVTASALNHLDVDMRQGVSRFPVEPPPRARRRARRVASSHWARVSTVGRWATAWRCT